MITLQDLRECLGYGIAGDFRVTREGEDRAPEPLGVRPIHGLDALMRFDCGDGVVHHSPRGHFRPKGDIEDCIRSGVTRRLSRVPTSHHEPIVTRAKRNGGTHPE